MFRLGVLFCCLLALVIGQNEVGNGEMLPQNPDFVTRKFYYSFNDKMDHYYCAARGSSVPWYLRLTRESCRIRVRDLFLMLRQHWSRRKKLFRIPMAEKNQFQWQNQRIPRSSGAFHTKIGWIDGRISPLDRTVVDGAVCDFEASILVTLAQPTFGGQHGGYQQQGGYQPTDYQNNWWQVPLSQGQRLKCTDVAVLDDDSCTTCCRLAARRSDSTIAEIHLLIRSSLTPPPESLSACAAPSRSTEFQTSSDKARFRFCNS